MAVIVVGDISQKEALAYIKKHFANIKPVASPRERVYANVPAYKDNKAMVKQKAKPGFCFANPSNELKFSGLSLRPVWYSATNMTTPTATIVAKVQDNE